MDLKKGNYEIAFTSEELWSLGLLIVNRLERSIKDHYAQLPSGKDGEESFIKQEEEKLAMMKFFFGLIGRSDIADSYIGQFKHLFEQKRKEK